MDTCLKIKELQSAGEPLPREYDAHLELCAGCQKARAAWDVFDSYLKQSFPVYHPPELVVRQMVAQAMEKSKTLSRRSSAAVATRWGWALAAAAVLLLAFLWHPWYKTPAGAPAATSFTADFNTKEVMLGQQTRMILKPGAVAVILGNTADQVNILLEKGEIYFQVKPQTYRSFTVQAGDLFCRVTGTRFVVNRENEFVRVSVINGKVDVKNMRSVAGPNHLVAGQSVELALLTNRLTHTMFSTESLRHLLVSFVPQEKDTSPRLPVAARDRGSSGKTGMAAAKSDSPAPEKASVCGPELPEIPWAAKNRSSDTAKDWMTQYSAFMQEGHFDLAVSTLLDQLNKPGLAPELRSRLVYQLATIYRTHIGNYHQAIRFYSEYLIRYPDSPEKENALFWLAECYRLSGNRDLALKNFKEYLSSYPKGYWNITTAKRISWLAS